MIYRAMRASCLVNRRNKATTDGAHRHQRLWNGGTGKGTVTIYRCGRLIDRIYAENVGCEYGEY